MQNTPDKFGYHKSALKLYVFLGIYNIVPQLGGGGGGGVRSDVSPTTCSEIVFKYKSIDSIYDKSVRFLFNLRSKLNTP